MSHCFSFLFINSLRIIHSALGSRAPMHKQLNIPSFNYFHKRVLYHRNLHGWSGAGEYFQSNTPSDDLDD